MAAENVGQKIRPLVSLKSDEEVKEEKQRIDWTKNIKRIGSLISALGTLILFITLIYSVLQTPEIIKSMNNEMNRTAQINNNRALSYVLCEMQQQLNCNMPTAESIDFEKILMPSLNIQTYLLVAAFALMVIGSLVKKTAEIADGD